MVLFVATVSQHYLVVEVQAAQTDPIQCFLLFEHRQLAGLLAQLPCQGLAAFAHFLVRVEYRRLVVLQLMLHCLLYFLFAKIQHFPEIQVLP